MSLKGIGRAWSKALAPFRRGDVCLDDLARRVEERAEIATLEAHAYIDAALVELKAAPPETGCQIEERALLATQEAKAYADGAIHSLSMALRGMSSVVLRLSRRVDACEAVLTDMGERASRIDRRMDELATAESDGRRQVEAIDGSLRDVATDLVDLEKALREIDQQLRDVAGGAGSLQPGVGAPRRSAQ